MGKILHSPANRIEVGSLQYKLIAWGGGGRGSEYSYPDRPYNYCGGQWAKSQGAQAPGREPLGKAVP